MKLNRLLILSILLLLTILISSCAIIGGKFSKNTFAEEVSADKLKDTVVSPFMEAKIDKSKNIVFCSTFQMAWNELKDNIIKSNIQLSGEPPLVGFLNSGKSSKKDLSDKDYVAKVGFKKDNIVKNINDELKGKFKNDAPTVDEGLLTDPDDILAYAYLAKALKFKKEFEAFSDPINFNSDKNVKAFGIDKFSDNGKHAELGKQVDIYGYNNTNTEKSFIVKLKSESENDEIILALVKPKDSLIDTVNYVSDIISKETPDKMATGDKLAIPVIDFNILKKYNELIDTRILNTGFQDYKIREAMQSIKFKLDEKGAVLKSEARISLAKSAARSNPKYMVFDRPFLLYLKEKNADYPYFAVWVNNDELLSQMK